MASPTVPGEHIFDVRVQEDFVEKLAAARPAQALAELIWNALDAEATRVTVETDLGLLGQTAIRVTDNGHSIPFDEVKALFTNIGGSWKRSTPTSRNGVRMLHGKEGKGRFRALALGRVVEWDVIAPDKDGGNAQYKVTLIKDSARRVRITDPTPAPPESEIGVEVSIRELAKDWNLSAASLIQELCEIYALYLVDYADVEIVVAGTKLDPTPLIQLQKSFELPPIATESNTFDVSLEVIEWKRPTERMLYLCNASKFPLHRITPAIHAPGFEFSAYLRSAYVSELHEAGTLDLAEMDPRLLAAVEEAREHLRKHFKARAIEETSGLVEQWKKDKVYPYPEEPTTNIQAVERQVFDIVAVNIASSLPELQSAESKSRKFQLRMLRQAIERGPAELQLILGEVLELPQRKRNELAKLLKRTTLSAIISAAKLVADRLNFLLGLETILFDQDLKKTVKERSQLHRILADNTWVFGEEFALTVDDQSLTEVLRQHLKTSDREIAVDEPVKRLDETTGIIDLMLSRRVPTARAEEHEHLIVELKAPKVKIGLAETGQIKSYAFAVIGDERFHAVPARWTFWVVSNDLDLNAHNEVHQANKPEGLLWEGDEIHARIWIKTWSQIINDCRTRLQIFQKELNHSAEREDSLAYLKEAYARTLQVNQADEDGEDNSTTRDAKSPGAVAR